MDKYLRFFKLSQALKERQLFSYLPDRWLLQEAGYIESLYTASSRPGLIPNNRAFAIRAVSALPRGALDNGDSGKFG
jgi:hypothetical protein